MAINPEAVLPGGPDTAADAFLDALIRHQVGLLRLSAGLGRKVRELLDASESDLRRAIRDRLKGQEGLTTPAHVRRLNVLLAEVKKIRGKSYRAVEELFEKEMIELAIAEPKFTDTAFKTVLPVTVVTKLPPAELLASIVTTRPFEGLVMKEWSDDIAKKDLDRIEKQIRIGLVQGESITQISRRVVGTVKLKGRNGVTQLTRKHAEAVSRTAVNSIANQARREFFKANEKYFTLEVFVATLDGNTTPVCRKFDGDRFKIGIGPIPPLHWRCRSLRAPALDDELLGRRPMKPVTQKGLLREFSSREGFPNVRSRKDLPFGTKGKFDAFARERTRELIGTVPAKVDYETFLGRQSVQFQEDVMGVTKSRLFRRGKLPLDKFVDLSGNEFTLKELAKFEKGAFEAAGLDPEDFL